MIRMNRVLLAAALLAAPAPALLAQGAQAPAEAAHRQHPQRAQHGQRPSPVAALLRHRAELKLTAQQVTRLEAVERDLARKNEPIRKQMEQLRRNSQAAREQVQAILTAEQKEAARALMREQRGSRGDRAGRGERGQRAPRSR